MNSGYLRHSANFGFYVIAIFLPISISITQIGLGIVLGSWALLVIDQRNFSFVTTPLNKPFLFYLGALVLSALLGYNPSNSLLSIRETWVCLIFFSMMALIRDFETVKRLTFLTLGASSIAALYGIGQHFAGGMDLANHDWKLFLQYLYPRLHPQTFATGFFNHHLTYGEMILIALSFSLAYLIATYPKTTETQKSGGALRVLLIILIVILALALLFSFAGSSWAGFVISFAFMLIFINRRTSILLLAILIPSIILIATFHPPTKERISFISSRHERPYIWKIALQFFVEKPVTGIGLNNWQGFVNPKIDGLAKNDGFTFIDGGVTQHAHNSFLTHLAEGGVIGAGTFLYIFFVIYRDGIKNYSRLKSSRIKRGIIFGSLTGITGFHGAGLFENTFGDSEVLMLVWFVTGLMYLCFTLPERRGEPV